MSLNEDRALKSILSGRAPDKKIMISTFDKNDPELVKYRAEKQQEKSNQEERNAMLRELRMPMFCPSCGFIMNKRLDTKFWNRRKKCFNCTIEDENEMRKNGTFEAYEKKIVLENKRDWLKDQIEQISEWKKKTSVSFLNQINPDGHHVEEEKWDVDVEKMQTMADEAIGNYMTELFNVETELLEL